MPSDPEREVEADRRRSGIPLAEEEVALLSGYLAVDKVTADPSGVVMT